MDQELTVADLIEQGKQRRKAIIAYVRTYQKDYGYSPSVREIAAEVGISPTGVRHHLQLLREAGKITSTPGRYRSTRITRR
jgi:repressor LexA